VTAILVLSVPDMLKTRDHAAPRVAR
jgi:hypothetical protein